MMKIIFNHDGSIKLITIPESIQQGNDGVDEIYLEWEGYSNSSYSCDAVFTLPNGSQNTLVAETSDNGYLITLTSAQTVYAGKLLASFRLKDLNTTLFSYQYEFQVNPTNADIDETTITIAQYNSIVQAMNSYLSLDGGTLNQDSSIVVETSGDMKKKATLDSVGLDLYQYAVGNVSVLRHTTYKAGEIYNYPAALTLPQTSGTLALVSQLNGKQNLLYRHRFKLLRSNYQYNFELITSSSASMTLTGGTLNNTTKVLSFASVDSSFKNLKYLGTSNGSLDKFAVIDFSSNTLRLRFFDIQNDGSVVVANITADTLTDTVEAL